jgi:hypothetical protein
MKGQKYTHSFKEHPRRMAMSKKPHAAKGNAKTNGGRYRIRTYDFHRVKVALYR